MSRPLRPLPFAAALVLLLTGAATLTAPASAADDLAFCGDVSAFCTHHCGEEPAGCLEPCRARNAARIEKAVSDTQVGLTEAGVVRGCNASCPPGPEQTKCLAACAADLGAIARCDEGEDGWWSIARYFVFPIVGLLGAFLFLAARKGSMSRGVDI